jgi:hypothetical protein
MICCAVGLDDIFELRVSRCNVEFFGVKPCQHIASDVLERPRSHALYLQWVNVADKVFRKSRHQRITALCQR